MTITGLGTRQTPLAEIIWWAKARTAASTERSSSDCEGWILLLSKVSRCQVRHRVIRLGKQERVVELFVIGVTEHLVDLDEGILSPVGRGGSRRRRGTAGSCYGFVPYGVERPAVLAGVQGHGQRASRTEDPMGIAERPGPIGHEPEHVVETDDIERSVGKG